MSSSTLMLILPLAALYVAFLLWHGGRGDARAAGVLVPPRLRYAYRLSGSQKGVSGAPNALFLPPP